MKKEVPLGVLHTSRGGESPRKDKELVNEDIKSVLSGKTLRMPFLASTLVEQGQEVELELERRLEARRVVAQARLRASSFPSQAHVQKRGRRQSR